MHPCATGGAEVTIAERTAKAKLLERDRLKQAVHAVAGLSVLSPQWKLQAVLLAAIELSGQLSKEQATAILGAFVQGLGIPLEPE